jgi:hypothetical protein
MGIQPVRGVEWVIAAPVTGEDVLVHLLIAGVNPALNGARVHVWGKSKRLVSRLPPAHTVSIRALSVGIEDAFIFPQAIEKSTRLGEPRVLPRHDLRPGPVDVEDLRLPSFQRGEVLVETPLLDFQLFVVVHLEILADFREPVVRDIGPEHSANHRTTGVPDRLTDCLRYCVVPYIGIIEFRHHSAPCSDLPEDDVDSSLDVVPHVFIGTVQDLATRRELELERGDLVTYVDLSPLSRSANSHGLFPSVPTPRSHSSVPTNALRRSEDSFTVIQRDSTPEFRRRRQSPDKT